MSAPTLPLSSDTLRLAIPDRQTGLDFLSRLPLANPAKSETLLSQFFESLLSTPPQALAYLNLLEQSRVPLCFVEGEQSRIFANKPLPLGDADEQVFRRVVAMWRTVTRAYSHCAQLDADTEDPEHRLRVALILHRCIYYTGMIIVEHFRARRELPTGIWFDLHGYYATAEEWGVATQPVADPLDPAGRPTHCAAAFATILLLDLAGPYSLSVKDQEIVFRWATQWAPLVSIHAIAPGESLPPFSVDLMQDAGLKAAAEILNKAQVRRIDTSRLAMVLTQVRQQLQQKFNPSQIGLGNDCAAPVCKRLLEHLSRPWTQVRSARKFRRQAMSGIAHVGTGFEEMHFLVSGKEFSQPETMQMYSRADFDTLFVFRHQDDPTAKLQYQQSARMPKPDDWEVVDQSAAGFRIVRSAAGNRVAHNQLLAVCPPDGSRYFFAQVTWLMQDRAGGLVVGIASLPGTPQAIAIRRLSAHTGKTELYTQAFMMPAIEAMRAPQTLVLPPGWFQPSRVIEVHADNQSIRCRLDFLVQDGPDFERVSYSVESASI